MLAAWLLARILSVDRNKTGFLDEEEAIHHEDRHLVFNMIGANDMHAVLHSDERVRIEPPAPLRPRTAQATDRQVM